MAELISHRDQISNLLATYRTKDPRLVKILETIMDDLHQTIVTVNPIEAAVTALGFGDTTPPGPVPLITVTLLPLNIQLIWGSVAGAQLYEIREGTVWATGTFILKTASLSAVLNPRAVGTYDMMICAMSPAGVYSTTPLAFQIIIPPMGAITLSASVIDNNVLLSWTIPTSSFQIAHYNVYRNTSKFAELTGTFLARFEAAAGDYVFEVEGVDIAGNTTAKASVAVKVKTPPDYILHDSRMVDLSTVSGINVLYDNSKIVACIDLVETIQQHFESRGWTDAQAQVTAGYERWIQDNLLSGSFTDTYDYGTLLTNTVAVVTYIKEVFSGTSDVTVSIGLSWSTDNVNWTPEVLGDSQFIPALRYLRTRMIFTAPNDDAMVAVSNVNISLSVKREVDSGSVMAMMSDPDGTTIYFNKIFKDVDSLTATAESLTPISVIVIFDDIPDPTFFKVMAFDSAGQRVSHMVDWKARGIVA